MQGCQLDTVHMMHNMNIMDENKLLLEPVSYKDHSRFDSDIRELL